jgi:hypothetical protein
MLALFLLFPRFAPLWGIPSDAMTGRSGLSNAMQVGNIAELALDDTIAARVQVRGPPPPQSQLYFRGPVLAQFDGREWRPLLPRWARFPAVRGATNLRVAASRCATRSRWSRTTGPGC